MEKGGQQTNELISTNNILQGLRRWKKYWKMYSFKIWLTDNVVQDFWTNAQVLYCKTKENPGLPLTFKWRPRCHSKLKWIQRKIQSSVMRPLFILFTRELGDPLLPVFDTLNKITQVIQIYMTFI